MPKFRKRPVVIEARLLDSADYDEACETVKWCGGTADENGCVINTLEGPLHASFGDWIIQGVAGEFYSCKADIFERTYEPAES